MIQRLAYSPKDTHSFHDALSACLHRLDALQDELPVLGAVFFVNADTLSGYREQAATILTAMIASERGLPANVLAQANSAAVAMEVWTDKDATNLAYKEVEDLRYARFTTGGEQALLVLGLHAAPEQPLQAQAEATFQHLHDLLEREGLALTDVVRQWNYVPDILTLHPQEGKTHQHYQLFNEVRKAWYAKHPFKHGYPAATGIGVKTGPFAIDALVITSRPGFDKKGLSNPHQQNAYQYDQQLLVGDALCGQQKNPPLFERAKLLAWPGHEQVIVSGTAAILGQETVGLGDVGLQTEVSIRNMLELITPTVTGSQTSFHFNGLRVYIKHLNDSNTVKAVCQRFFPDVSASFVQADVCRDNLLMEIEGEAVAQSDAP